MSGDAERGQALVLRLRELLATGDLTCELCDLALAAPLAGQWPQRLGAESFVGEVCTVHSPFGELAPVDRALDHLEPGQVLLIANGSPAAIWGGRLTERAKSAGVAGVVVDGCVRDVAELRVAGLPLVARGVAPNRSAASGPGAVDVGVTVGGCVVHSGDILVADANGVVVIEAKRGSEVLARLARS